jgi:hypothetical protein
MKAIVLAALLLVCLGCAGATQQTTKEMPPGYWDAKAECEYEAEKACATLERHSLQRSQCVRDIASGCMRMRGY